MKNNNLKKTKRIYNVSILFIIVICFSGCSFIKNKEMSNNEIKDKIEVNKPIEEVEKITENDFAEKLNYTDIFYVYRKEYNETLGESILDYKNNKYFGKVTLYGKFDDESSYAVDVIVPKGDFSVNLSNYVEIENYSISLEKECYTDQKARYTSNWIVNDNMSYQIYRNEQKNTEINLCYKNIKNDVNKETVYVNVRWFLTDKLKNSEEYKEFSKFYGFDYDKFILEINKAINNPSTQFNAHYDETGKFLMEVHDVFVINDRGTIVTGTVVRGKATINDSVEILGMSDKILKSKIVGIMNLNENLQVANFGENVGLFLDGITREQIHEGQVIAITNSMTQTKKYEAEIKLFTYAEGGLEMPLYTNSSQNIIFTNTEINGKIQLKNVKELQPGKSANAIIELESNVGMEIGTNFLIVDLDGRDVGRGTVTKLK